MSKSIPVKPQVESTHSASFCTKNHQIPSINKKTVKDTVFHPQNLGITPLTKQPVLQGNGTKVKQYYFLFCKTNTRYVNVIPKIDDFCNFERFSRRPPKLSDAENDPKSDEATFVTLKT